MRDALARIADDMLLWEDWPYADRSPATGEPAMVEPLTPAARAARIAACAAYRSQLGFRFGGEAAMRARVASISEERFHRAGGPAFAARPPVSR